MRKRKKESIDPSYHLKESEIMSGTSDFREGSFAFITEGSLALRELGHFGVTRPIPRGESAITALAAGKGRRKIYGATSGKKSHLFCYDPSPAAEHAIDIGILGENAQCPLLFIDPAGAVYGVVNPGGRIFRYDPRGEFSVLWKYEANEIEFFAAAAGEEVSSAAWDPSAERIFGFTRRSSRLFVFDAARKRMRIIREIERAGRSNAVAFDGNGNLIGSGKNGFLFRYHVPSGRFQNLDLQLPSPKGMEHVNAIDSVTSDGVQHLYIGTTLGTLCRLNTVTLEITAFGRPSADHRIRALAFGADGIVYGAAGGPGKNSHLFRLNPGTGEVRDLGIPMVHFPMNWICYDIGALAVGRNGEIYIGEAERISYLMIYYPPALPRN